MNVSKLWATAITVLVAFAILFVFLSFAVVAFAILMRAIEVVR